MKKITLLKMQGCPYCAQALAAIKEVTAENPEYAAVEVEIVDKHQDRDRAADFADKYYYVPSMFVDGEKIYEASPGESYGECLLSVKKVFRAAV